MPVPREDMNKLQSAADLKSIAESAEVDAQVASIAYALNSAANTGETSVVWIGRMLAGTKTQVEAKGYTVEPTKLHTGESADDEYTLSFGD